MVFFPMFRFAVHSPLLLLSGLSSLALFFVGCAGTKNTDLADAPPPPPAAYPDGGSEIEAASSGASMQATGGVPAPASSLATNRPAPPAPEPFELREGETLVTHNIESGETLSVIATKYNTTVGRILSANGMTDTRIYAGKSLQVPTPAPQTSLAQNSAPAPAASQQTPAPSAAPAATSYDALASGGYPSTTTAPAPPASAPAPPAPPTTIVPPAASGAIAPPPLPPGATPPPTASDPASTSYPRTSPTPPSFDASRVQFSN